MARRVAGSGPGAVLLCCDNVTDTHHNLPGLLQPQFQRLLERLDDHAHALRGERESRAIRLARSGVRRWISKKYRSLHALEAP